MQKKINESLGIIANAINRFPNIAVASSFGKDSMVLMDLCQRIDPNIKILSVMTPFKPKETLEFKEYITDIWELNIETFTYDNIPDRSRVESRLYETDPDYCCEVYKVEPLAYGIKKLGLDAWMTGLRNTEGGEMREKFSQVVEEKEDGLFKINPILNWTEKDIWMYHALEGIPIHPLYIQGYRSLGCAPCSKISENDNEPERAGRWAGTDKIECGIHSKKRMRG